MIPIGPGDIAKALGAISDLVALIKAPQQANKLARWAELLTAEDSDETARARLEFLQGLTQDRGFTPWYEYAHSIDVPKDTLCDIVDLLVAGPQAKGGWLSGLLGSKKPKSDMEEWADLIQQGQPNLILQFLRGVLIRCGRTRQYREKPAIAVDVDWLADVGMWLIG